MDQQEEEQETSYERSQEQAEHVKAINTQLLMVDERYLRTVAKKTRKQADHQDSAAVLIGPKYTPKRTELLRKLAETMESLAEYKQKNRELDRLREELKAEEQTQQDIEEMFGL